MSSDLTSNWSQTSSTERNRQTQYFKETLSESGVILISGTSPHILSQESPLVIRDLEKILLKHATYPRNIERFNGGLNRFCGDEEDFRKILLPTELHKSSESGDLFSNSENVMQQESVFRILLNVACLQKHALDLLFESLVKYAIEENVDETWVPLLLKTLRYFPYIKEPNVLCKKLMDALDVATYPSQLEILNLLPDIIPNMQHDEIAKQLGVFLDENSNLAGAVVNCLNLLQISTQTKADIQDRILAKLFCDSCFKIFPILYDFLVNNANVQDLQGIFVKIRSMLETFLSSSDDNTETETNKTVLLTKLYTSAVSSKIVYNTWLALLTNIRSSHDHKFVDVLLMFLLHSTTETRRHNTEMLFKKKIKTGQLKIALLEVFFKNITPQFLKDHFDTFLKIAFYLLQNSKTSPAMRDFASTLYRETFLHEKTDCFQHQDIIHNLLLATTRTDQEIVSAVLKVFTELIERDFVEVQKHALQIMALLENLDVFELKEVKDVFEILCRLTCGEKTNDGLKDEIHMIVRKQLQRPEKLIKHKGIVAAVVMAKHIATTSSEQTDINIDEDTTISMADLPDARSKEAAGLIDLTNISSESSPDSITLFYDELASMLITDEKLDKYFLAWLKDTITNDFQNIFIAEDVSSSINDIPITVQYSLNTEDEINEPICVNIAELTLKSQTNQILILSPMFRLLRLLHYSLHGGDLESIDALLGCGIAMPTITDNMDSDQIKQAADCVFHCINWFRENISAFVVQKNRVLRIKVLQRIKNVIELERTLQELILQVPEHKLPGAINKKQKVEAKRGKKAAKSKEIINETTTSVTTQTTKSSASSSRSSKSNEIEISFREMDTDVILLLKYPVKINDEIVSQSSQSNIQLDLKQFGYVLKDVIAKLEVLVNGKRVGLSPLNTIKSSSIINDIQRFLINISRTLNKISIILKQTLDENDGRYDLPDLFNDQMEELKNTFGIILHFIALTFSWNGFQDTKNLNFLRDCLKALRDDTSSELNSTNRQTLDFASKLYTNYLPVCMHITHAVELVKILQVFYAITESNDLKKMIVASAGKFLKRKWYNRSGNPESGKLYNLNLSVLLKAYLNGADVKTISGLIGTLQKQAPDLQSKDDCLHTLGSIDKPALPVLFQALCNALLERVRSQLTSLTNNEHLTLWKTTGLSLQGLMTVVKIHETRVNLVCFFKKSIGILKLFLNQGIPILEIMLKTKPDEVVDIFKTIQSTTRFLHHLCCHSKLTRDTSVITYVPQFRLTLETLVYRVKAALVANNCSDAFWMGNLRNRNLHGEDILTQDSTSTVNDNDEEEDDDDALPADEDSDEEMILGEERSNTSASEVI